MDRLACVNVAALPLQILLRAHPTWASLPVVVVEDDRPQAPVLWLNAQARRAGIRAGQRYATALTLARSLRAGAVPQPQIEEGVCTLADHLRRHSPHVEPAADMAGVFWLDVQGLASLYPSLETWADRVRAALQRIGMKAAVAVGYSRFGVYALAMSHGGTVVCADAAEETARMRRVPIGCLNLAPKVQERLFTLGIATVGDFLRLPREQIRLQFGAATDALYQLAAGRRWAPLSPAPAREIPERSVNFDAPESNAERLLRVIRGLLDELVAELARRFQAIVDITLEMKLDDRSTRSERVRPAVATLDVAQLLALIDLRLHALELPAGIVTLRVTAGTCPATPDQTRLFNEQSRRDRGAADRALARLHAECGERSVVRAHLCDAHLPGARFEWRPIEHVPARPAPRKVAARPLVRRIYSKPLPLAVGSIGAPAGPSSNSFSHSFSNKVSREGSQDPPGAEGEAEVCGPYVISGGWWAGDVGRDYYFVHATDGELLWVYYDRRRRFFLEGQVE